MLSSCGSMERRSARATILTSLSDIDHILLRPGVNVLAVAVTNTGEAPIRRLDWFIDLNYQDGSREVVKTDKEWSAGLTAQPGWEQA